MRVLALVCLVGAVIVCGLAVGVSTASGRDDRSLRVARGLLWIAVAGIATSTSLLIVAILQRNFGWAYVADQSRLDSNSWYRLAALWGGAEGSLLWFTCLLAPVMVITLTWRAGHTLVADHDHDHHDDRGATALVGCVLGLLGLTVALFANPFDALAIPAIRGDGLSPILEHPAMLYHPPILYLGLVTTAVPFVAWFGRPVAAPGSLRRWLAVPWALLTVGLATGANWAYLELGWGGYWAWDPVENTVLVPWLLLTGALHMLRSPTMAAHERLLRVVIAGPFVTMLFGNAVTRSGGLSSVHAFADAQALGAMLGLLVGLVALALLWDVTQREPHSLTPTRRDLSAVATMLSLLLALAVLVGVSWPLIAPGEQVVSGAWFAWIAAPIAIAGGITHVSLSRRAHTLVIDAVMIGLSVAVVIAIGARTPMSIATAVVAPIVLLGALRHFTTHRRWAVMLGHVGFVVLMVGVAGSTNATETRVGLVPGQSATVGGWTFDYIDHVVTDGPRMDSELVTAMVEVRSGSTRHTLEPGVVHHRDRALFLAEADQWSQPLVDIQTTVRVIRRDGVATFDFAVRPLVSLVWLGVGIIAVAGLVTAASRRQPASSGQAADTEVDESAGRESAAPVGHEGSDPSR